MAEAPAESIGPERGPTRVDREAIALVKARFPDAVAGEDAEAADPWIRVEAGRLVEVAGFLRDDPATRFDSLSLVSGVDYPSEERIEVVYHLVSLPRRVWFVLKVWCEREDPRVPTVSGIWRTADWQERETYDLFGVRFEGHPELRRILCDDDWEGWPLRKDYVFPKVFRGIRCETY